MAADHIRYDLLAQEALRGVVRKVLADVAKTALPGEHHFYIAFDTARAGRADLAAPAREISGRNDHRAAAPVLGSRRRRHAFEVGLSFGGVPERLSAVRAIKGFFDPSVQFGLQFEQVSESGDATAPDTPESSVASTPPSPAPQELAAPPTAASSPAAKVAPDEPDKPPGGGEVVRLDRFRKK